CNPDCLYHLNSIDRDSDDVGIEDIIEGHDANNDGIAEWDVDNNQFLDVSEGSADSNNNGIPDAFDRSLGGIIAALPDSDNDGLLNFRDTDDDGDGVLTSLEDANGNGDFSDDFTNGQQGANAGLPNYLFNQFTVLPVELISFSGEWIDSKVELRWATATEINNDRFEVERSHDAINFITLGVVNGRGNSSTINEYEYRDNNPLSGISYYRLKQVDFDGAFEYSEIVRVESQVTFDNLKFSVFPNPARSIDNLNIQLITYAPELPLNLRILDTNGTVIRTLENIDIPFSDKLTLGVQELKLKSGVYLIQVTQQRKTAVYRVLIL
ncbi:MAG: T9SS type A sorting domain-containing protein, partial [Bacteroidota bacterium]